MPNYPSAALDEVTVVGVLPTAPIPWVDVVLPNGPGTYVLESLAVHRTAGVGSATVAPVVSSVPLATLTPLDVVDVSAATAYSVAPWAGAFLRVPGRGAQFNCNGTIAVAVNPNVLGVDTFTVKVRARRVA